MIIAGLESLMMLSVLLGTVLMAATAPEGENPMTNQENAPVVRLGYVILYVRDVEASLAFYERAFGLRRRFYNDDAGKAYGELDTGGATISFASLPLAIDQLGQEPQLPERTKPPIGAEIALLTSDVKAVYARAVAAGALPVKEPAVKPWGQTVAYVRDNAGHLVEICTPVQ